MIVRGKPDELHEGNVLPSVDSAAHMLELLHLLPGYRKLLGRRGRKHWQNNYTWQNITQKYLELYEGAAA